MTTPPPSRIRHSTILPSPILTIVRWAVLVFALTTLVLDIISINESIRHSRRFIRFLPQLHLPNRAYIPFVLAPDVMAIALFTILLWPRMQLPDRLHNVHTVCRILSSVVLVGLALFCPAAEAHLVGEEHRWERYWCQNMDSWRERGSSDAMTSGDASVRDGSGNGTTSTGNSSTSPLEAKSSTWQSERRQTCLVMRTRAMVAFVWAALVLLELALAVWAGEFKSKKKRRRGLGVYGAQGTLDKMSNPSTSHVWSEEDRDEEQIEEVFEEEFNGLSDLEDEEQSQISITDSCFQLEVGGPDHSNESMESHR